MALTDELKSNTRDMLIRHIDGAQVPILVPVIRRGLPPGEWRTLQCLIDRGFIKFDRVPHPRYTVITDKGRHALAKALADWADALARTGHGSGFLMAPEERRANAKASSR